MHISLCCMDFWYPLTIRDQLRTANSETSYGLDGQILCVDTPQRKGNWIGIFIVKLQLRRKNSTCVFIEKKKRQSSRATPSGLKRPRRYRHYLSRGGYLPWEVPTLPHGGPTHVIKATLPTSGGLPTYLGEGALYLPQGPPYLPWGGGSLPTSGGPTWATWARRGPVNRITNKLKI